MPSNRQIRRKIEREATPEGGHPGRWKPLALAGAALVILVGTPVALAQLPGSEAQAPAASPTAESPAAATPSATSPEGTSSPSESAREIPAFAPPTVDTDDPEAVARGWAYIYHSRNEQDDFARFDAAEGYIPEGLRHRLLSRATSGDSPLAGLGASHMEKVRFSRGNTQDTPIRWARNATVTVQTEAGPTLAIDYELQADATDEGWKLTRATERGWTEVE